MAQSKRYNILLRQITKLQNQLLPSKYHPTGHYSDRVLTRTIAFKILAHAEIEDFIEDIALEVITGAINKFTSSSIITQPLLCLLAFCGVLMEEPPSTLTSPQPSQTSKWDEKIHLDKKIKKARTIFHSKVIRNNGLKEENLLNLFLPIGLLPQEIDPLWLTRMNNFGSERGEVAHTSRLKLKQLPDPATLVKDINEIVKELGKIDIILINLTI